MLTLAVPFVGASSAAATECGQGEPCIVITIDDGGESISVSRSDIQAGPAPSMAYQVRSKKGEAAEPIDPQPTAVLSIRDLADLTDGDSYTFSETPNAGGSPSVLAPGEFDDGVVYITSDDKIGYIRPLRDENDVNSSDIFSVSSLELTLHTTGTLLTPEIKVSQKTDTGTANAFTVDTGFDGPVGSYKWDFGNNEGTSADAAPTHTYAKVGKYPVVVEVRGEDGSYGRSDATTMTVGKPAKVKAPGTGGSGGGTATGRTPGTGGGTGTTPGTGDVPLPGYNGGAPGLPATPGDPLAPPGDNMLDESTTEAGEQVHGFILTGSGSATGEQIPGTPDLSLATPETRPTRRTVLLQSGVGGLAVVLLLAAGAVSESRWLRTRLHPLRRHA